MTDIATTKNMAKRQNLRKCLCRLRMNGGIEIEVLSVVPVENFLEA